MPLEPPSPAAGPGDAGGGEEPLRRLTVTLLVDNRVEARGLRAEHGLALLLDAEGARGERTVLFDTGQSGAVLRHNLDALRIDPGGIADVVLSHGHYDHAGGLRALLSGAPRPRRVVCHPRFWGPRYRARPRLSEIGSGLEAAEVRGAGVELIEAAGPFALTPGLWTTGGIAPREPWERPAGFLRAGAGGRVGDEIDDDIGLVADLGDAGLVLVTGCCHGGIAGMLGLVRRRFGNRRIAGIVGGLHLRGASDERLERTIAALSREAPAALFPLHCSGAAEVCRLRAALGEAVRFAAAGDRLCFPG